MSESVIIPRCAHCANLVADRLSASPAIGDLVVCIHCVCLSKVITATQTRILTFDDWMVLTTTSKRLLADIEAVQKRIQQKNALANHVTKSNTTMAVQTL